MRTPPWCDRGFTSESHVVLCVIRWKLFDTKTDKCFVKQMNRFLKLSGLMSNIDYIWNHPRKGFCKLSHSLSGGNKLLPA